MLKTKKYSKLLKNTEKEWRKKYERIKIIGDKA